MGKLTVLKYLPKNIALLVQKLWRKKKFENSFPAILRRKEEEEEKIIYPLRRGGGG